jgi:hypothetical protein
MLSSSSISISNLFLLLAGSTTRVRSYISIRQQPPLEYILFLASEEGVTQQELTTFNEQR